MFIIIYTHMLHCGRRTHLGMPGRCPACNTNYFKINDAGWLPLKRWP